MASATPAKKMKEEATCSICLNLMVDPVSISCGHSYCRLCIEGFLENVSHTQPQQEFLCPQCRAPFQMASLRPNKQLGNLIEAIKEINCEMVCEEHGEQLHLFCEDDGQLICWRCERAPQHKGHTTALVEDVSQGYKEKLQKVVTNLRQLNNECMNLKALTTKQISEWKDVKDTLNRSWAVKLETPEALSLELNTVYSVPELYFDVKKMLRSYQVGVTLDPDTAHRELILSEDRRQVTRGYPQDNLDTSSRRFSAFPCVLGCEGFTSGRHYFEVDVGEGTGWDLGVCIENVQRDKSMKQKPEFGFWTIRLCKKKGYIALTSLPVYLHLKEQPLVVGVLLDCEAGVVSFYNMTTGSHIFTFPKASFSDTLRPYFQVYQYSPLFLPPPDEEGKK
ncbi:E3 ubiquitin-protein ligase TRIM38 isoform 4-T4 [Trichechus inunguis]|uniref:E3 ubiquitin-protein ligase TRIM38 n=1 Tax=Trichechus manatus latirostris TaxID=127582 RepID=A0A2Y9RRB6_TRIMA|nr:E3 ubiquitin-protein ligase TRIM38 isoform X2 [Trichechus manatus latirostris]